VSRLVVLAGPSGVGKGTVLQEVRRLLPDLWTSVSVTTRAPREGEVEGRHYHFVDRAEYDRLVAGGELLEHSVHFGNGYGTPRGPVERALAEGRPAVLEIDYVGARQVREAMGGRAALVMLLPPSMAELERRLAGRGTEDAAAVARRLDRAREEIAAQGEYDLAVVNVDVGETARQLIPLWGSQQV